MDNINLYITGKRNEKSILVVGDYIRDIYYYGKCDRISPEAPVPVVKKTHIEEMAGGAGNVSINIASLGSNVMLGGFFPPSFNFDIVKSYGVDIFVKECPHIKIPVKNRIVSSGNQIVRYDDEENYTVPESHIKEYIEEINSKIKSISCIVISDYCKGNLELYFVNELVKLSKMNNIPIIVDTKRNINIKEWYSNCHTLKVNKNEFESISVKNNFESISECIKHMNLKACCVTMSDKGLMFERYEKIEEKPSKSIEVFDVTGAGDSCTAALAISLVNDFTDSQIVKFVNCVGQCKVQHHGTYAVSILEVKKYLYNDKIISIDDIDSIKRIHNNKSIVFTNGCFDLLHAGHVDSLKFAKSQGNILIVAINTDKSVKKLKGESRPIIDEKSRSYIVSCIEYVDYVILFDDETPIDIIKSISPSVIVKGGEWGGNVVGEDYIKKYGGTVVLFNKKTEVSTTEIIKKIIDKSV